MGVTQTSTKEVTMATFSVFDLIGPVMIGPSSSHTAGAVRLGGLARAIFAADVVRCQCYLHGSFAETYKGHGTHLALAAGLMGWLPDDERIRDSLTIAEQAGLEFTFHPCDLGEEQHPNTVKLMMQGDGGQSMTVMGSSLGGGLVMVNEVNGFPVQISGSSHATLVVHLDRPGVVARVTRALADDDNNISHMTVSRTDRGSDALMVIETDQPVSARAMVEMRSLLNVKTVSAIQPIGG